MTLEFWQTLIATSPAAAVAIIVIIFMVKWNERQQKYHESQAEFNQKQDARQQEAWEAIFKRNDDTATREKATYERQLAFLERRVATLESKLTKKEDEYTSLKSEKDAEIADLKKTTDTRIAELEEEIKQLRGQLRDSAAQATNLSQLVKELTEVNTLLATERDDFKKRLSVVEKHQKGDTDKLKPPPCDGGEIKPAEAEKADAEKKDIAA